MTGISRRAKGGQSLVEFSLVLPIFLLIVFGLLDLGRFVYMNSVVSQAAREGARLAAVEASWLGSTDPACGTLGGPVCPADVTALRADILTAVNRMVAPFGQIPAADVYLSCDATTAPTGAWTTQTCATHAPGDLASVRLKLTFTAITPVIGSLVGPITTPAAATMIIN